MSYLINRKRVFLLMNWI